MSQFKYNKETNRVEEKADLDSPTDDGSMNDSNYHLWEEYTAAQKYLRSYLAATGSVWPEGWFDESEMEFNKCNCAKCVINEHYTPGECIVAYPKPKTE